MGTDAGPVQRTAGVRALKRSTLWVLGALTAFGPLSIDMYLPGLPSLARNLAITPSLAQLTISVSLVGLAGGQLLAGPIADARGRRGPLLGGLLVYVLTSVGCAVSPSIVPLLILRLIQGAAGGAGITIARAVVRDRAEGRAAARAYAALMAVSGLGPIVSPVVGGLLLHIDGWRGIFLALTVVGVLVFGVCAWLIPETLAPERRDRGGLRGVRHAMRVLFTDRLFVGHTLTGSFAFAAMMAYIAASPFVLERIHGLSPQLYSVVFATNGIGLLVFRQLSTRWLDRLGPRRIIRAALAAQLVGAGAVLADVVAGLGIWPLLGGFFLVAASNGAILPMATALAMQDHPERAGSASGLVGFTQYLLGSAVAPLVGSAGSGSAVPVAIAIPACALAAGVALRFDGTRQADAARLHAA